MAFCMAQGLSCIHAAYAVRATRAKTGGMAGAEKAQGQQVQEQ
jgi:hypothetical protein